MSNPIVVVTDRQYIVAKKIFDISMQEGYDSVTVGVGAKRKEHIIKTYTINIRYETELGGHAGHLMNCQISLNSNKQANKIFRSLIEQIREQCPDQVYLDKAMEKLLKGSEHDIKNDHGTSGPDTGNDDEIDFIDQIVGIDLDRKSKKASKSRKAKRKNKTVPRRAKKRN